MYFRTLREANTARQREWDAGGEANNLYWRMNELAGEAGEVCNILKKIHRERVGVPGSRATLADLAEELADVVICIDLYMMTARGPEVRSAVAVPVLQAMDLPQLGVQLQTSVGQAAVRLSANPAVTGEFQLPALSGIYIVLWNIALREGIDLDKAVAQKFNATSKKMGLETMMEINPKPDADLAEAIPPAVFYDLEKNCFRDFAGARMSYDFWKKWRGRKNEFPTHPPFRD